MRLDNGASPRPREASSMKTKRQGMPMRRLHLFADLLLGAAAIAAAPVRGALAGAASPSGTASAGAAPSAEAPPTKGMEDDPPGEEKSPTPSLDEWKGAAKI